VLLEQSHRKVRDANPKNYNLIVELGDLVAILSALEINKRFLLAVPAGHSHHAARGGASGDDRRLLRAWCVSRPMSANRCNHTILRKAPTLT
jgi:hypothetical protein